jgi:hypothetical protein
VSTSLEVGSRKANGTESSCVEKLSEQFPEAAPLRIAITVTATGRQRNEEQTIIEFGTPHEALFGSSLPLKDHDEVRLANADRSIDLQGTVTAVQTQDNRKAVAVRFAGTMRHWTKKK